MMPGGEDPKDQLIPLENENFEQWQQIALPFQEACLATIAKSEQQSGTFDKELEQIRSEFEKYIKPTRIINQPLFIRNMPTLSLIKCTSLK